MGRDVEGALFSCGNRGVLLAFAMDRSSAVLSGLQGSAIVLKVRHPLQRSPERWTCNLTEGEDSHRRLTSSPRRTCSKHSNSVRCRLASSQSKYAWCSKADADCLARLSAWRHGSQLKCATFHAIG